MWFIQGDIGRWGISSFPKECRHKSRGGKGTQFTSTLQKEKGSLIAIKEATEMLVAVVTMMGFQILWIHAPGSGGEAEEELRSTLSSASRKIHFNFTSKPEQEVFSREESRKA